MHRADKALADRIEMAYLTTGWRPIQGMFTDNKNTGGCALGVLGVRNFMKRDLALVGRPYDFCNALAIGFNSYRRLDINIWNEFAWTAWSSPDDDASRGFRLGYSVAKRMFSKAPIEQVPQRETVGV